MLSDAASQHRIALQLAAEPVQALGWLRSSAEQGFRDAQLGLAIALEEGRGTARNPAEAASWYMKAADAGGGEALYRLALLYDEGSGVPRDTVKARDLLGRAVDLGHEGARERVGRLLGPGPFPADNADFFKGSR